MAIFKKLKQLWKRITCKHLEADLLRWHWTHGLNGNKPATVEAEYKCVACGELTYLHLGGKESFEWAKVMGNHKKE